MGADGHIRIYDADIVDSIKCAVMKNTGMDENTVYFPGYYCEWTCNGKRACLVYWGDNMLEDMWEYWMDYAKTDEQRLAKQVFQERCNAEAVIVSDQEVWT